LCGLAGATTADHIVPRKFGGDDSIDNLRPAHVSCNSARGTMTLDDWFAKRISKIDGRPFFNNDSNAAPRQALPFFPDRETIRPENVPAAPESRAWFESAAGARQK
jgi:hypothetical protein